jgi:glutamate N-acetyltransferase/amino-acid N-acetyltransferase
VDLELERSAVRIGPITLFEDGQPHDERAPAAAEYLKRQEVELEVHLGAGEHEATMWTCDLTAEYVRINAEYRT